MLPNRYEVVLRVHESNPGLIRNAHAFTNAVAYELWKENPSWGHNIKRGTQGLSEDAICKLDEASPLKVRVSTSPNNGRGIYVVDIIAGAGGPNPQPAWIDQTMVTLNGGTTADWSKPVPVDTGTVEPPVVTPPTKPTVECKFTACECKFSDERVLAELKSLRERVDELAIHFDSIGDRLVKDVNGLLTKRTCRLL